MRKYFYKVSLLLSALLLVATASISAIAADPAHFDAEKKYSILAGSAIMGDPARYKNLATGHEGGTVVTTVLNPTTGLTRVMTESGVSGI